MPILFASPWHRPRRSRSLAALGALILIGCSGLFARAPVKPKLGPDGEPVNEAEAAQPLEEESSDAEVGASHLALLIKQFSAAVQERKFPEAERTLKRAERGVARASTMTRSHPDFEDLEAAIKRDRPRLEAAIEQDRIERRNASIDALIRQGELAMQQGATILQELKAHPPQPPDVEHLQEAITTLRQLKTAGEDYTDEPRYRSHSEERDGLLAELSEVEARASRQLAAQDAVAPGIEAGIVAANRAKTAPTPPEQLAAWRQVNDAFNGCVTELERVRVQPGFDSSITLTTRLGALSAADTQTACARAAGQARERVDRFAWESAVHAQLTQVADALGAQRSATAPADQEKAAQAALLVLGACEDNTVLGRGMPGIDRNFGFDTPWGKLPAAALIARCGVEAQKTAAALPGLHWLALADSLPPQLQGLQARASTAQALAEPGQAAEAWSAAVGGFQECIARSQELLGTAGADKAATFGTPWGPQTMPGIAKACADERKKAEQALALALARSQTASFVATCQGDEVEVVRREGMPTRIEVLPQGRLFVYGAAGAAQRRFGFNKQGQRVDFSLQYRQAVQAMLDQLATGLAPARGDGKAAADAMVRLLPTLDACQNGSITEQHAGYDDTATFETPFGRLKAPELRKACAAEGARLRGRQNILTWQARVEALRDRVQDAQTQLTQAAAEGLDPNTQVHLVEAALGSYTECSERADALAHATFADRKFKIGSVMGTLTVGDLGRACAKAKPAAEKKLAAALAVVKRQAFIATCRGDEGDVVIRLGLPTRVEPTETGRVFVYGKKRLIFDAAGKRTQDRSP